MEGCGLVRMWGGGGGGGTINPGDSNKCGGLPNLLCTVNNISNQNKACIKKITC